MITRKIEISTQNLKDALMHLLKYRLKLDKVITLYISYCVATYTTEEL